MNNRSADHLVTPADVSSNGGVRRRPGECKYPPFFPNGREELAPAIGATVTDLIAAISGEESAVPINRRVEAVSALLEDALIAG